MDALLARVRRTKINGLLYELNSAELDIRKMKDSVEKKCAKIREEMSFAISQKEKDKAKLAQEIKGLAIKHRKELFEEKGKKTITLEQGDIAIQWNPPAVNIKSTKLVIERLRELKLWQFIRTLEEVDKEEILKWQDDAKDDLVKVKGLTITQKEQLGITTSAITKPITFELKKKKII